MTGGDGNDACSGYMRLQAVLACAGVTMRSVATALGIDIRGARLHAAGQLTLAAPWGSPAIRPSAWAPSS
ncbi:MAG: hypothetical protein ACYDDU_14720 [Dermatophilaceae bacterium]